MSDRFADLIIIAGIDYSGCRGLITDGAGFADPVRETVDWSINANPVNQILNTNFIGMQFGITIGADNAGNLITKVNDTLLAIRAQLGTDGTFHFQWEDQQYKIEARCVKDTTQAWYQYGPYSAGYLESIVFRFIIKQNISIKLSTEA